MTERGVRALAHQQIARAMLHQLPLLLRSLSGLRVM